LKSIAKIILVVVALSAIAILFQAFRIIMLVRSPSAKVFSIESSNSGHRPLPDLAEGLLRQTKSPPIKSQDISELMAPHKKSLVPLADSLSLLGEVEAESEARFSKELPARLIAIVKSLPEAPAIPEVLPMNPAGYDLSLLRDTSHYWYLMGRWFMNKERHETAIAIAIAGILLAHEVETGDIIGLSITVRGMANYMRNIANTALLEMPDRLNIPSARLKIWANVLLRLHNAATALEKVCLCAKKAIPSAFHSNNLKVGDRLSEVINDSRSQQEIAAYFDPIIAASSRPFRDAIEIVNKKDEEVEELHRIVAPGLHYISYFLNPEDLMTKYIMSMALPRFKDLFERDFRAQQIFRGTVVVMALRAYQLEHDALPDSLAALETWFGKSLPITDLYSNKPMVYNKSGSRILASTGADGQPDTNDDLVFMPVSP
jgi:hypothetical protein